MSDELSSAEVAAMRELLDKQAIQDVMTRYLRFADRRDPDAMKTIFWEEGTDDHGMYNGPADKFFAILMEQGQRPWALDAGVGRTLAHNHNLGPAYIEFVGNDQAKVESYFNFVCTRNHHGEDVLGTLIGRYRDLFEKRNGEWRVLHRTVVYDTAAVQPYEPAWDFFAMVDAKRGASAPNDPIYDASWAPSHEDEIKEEADDAR